MPIPVDKLKIGRSLIAGGPITQETLQRELQASGKAESVLGRALLQSGFPSEEALVVLLLQRLRIPKINARNTRVPLETVRLIPEALAKKHRCLAIDHLGKILVVVTPDLGNFEGIEEIRRLTGHLLTPIQCAPEGFESIVEDYYKQLAASGLSAVEPLGSGGGASGGSSALKAIPAGDAAEDFFFKIFMSNQPLPAEEVPM
ncbi:MAG: hypothetical protein JKY65_10345 [Planctomycetes bacterium]|nr:hypothetical protein [Planctomycetota bacterium]